MYYNKYFSYNSINIKNIWMGIKQIVTLKPKSLNSPNKIIKNNSIVTDAKLIANAFNDYFSNVGNEIANSLPATNISPLNFMDSKPINSFCLFPVTQQEMELEIHKLKVEKSSGPFSIPTKLLKLLKCFLSKPLEIIFNISLNFGIVPDKFKVARVVPVFKKGSSTQLNNYRPISLLPIFNRILENLMYKRLIYFIEKNNVLLDNQFGFRSNHSTIQTITLLTDKIVKRNREKLLLLWDIS